MLYICAHLEISEYIWGSAYKIKEMAIFILKTM